MVIPPYFVLLLNRSTTREVTCIFQFITNNHTSFHLWSKQNLLNHQIVSKYYENDCLESFLLLSVSLLTALIVKKNHILGGIYFNVSRKRPRKNL